MLMMGEMDKLISKDLTEENKKKQAESMFLKKGYKMSDVESMMQTIGKKMQEQAKLLESKLSKK
jgi:hypothetical protein